MSTEITETVAPPKTIVVNGFPSYQTKYKDISIICNERLIQPLNVLEYSGSLNPFETYNLLDQVVLASSLAAINIAPLGNKLMSLGACFYAIPNRKVRVVYPFPERYDNVTTDEYSDSWVYRIPLIDKV